MSTTTTDDKSVLHDFKKAVNMTPAALRKWLDTDESKEVGYKGKSGGESVGHKSGRHILRIVAKEESALNEADRKHMTKVIGYVHRNMAQRPPGDISQTPWRYSLMNWGHDPMHKK